MELMFLSIINSNSIWYKVHEGFDDALKERRWIEGFLKRWGFSEGILDSEYSFERLSELRSVLSDAADSTISGTGLTQKQIEDINRFLGLSAFTQFMKPQNGRYALEFRPVNEDWNYVMSRIAASFVQAVGEGEPGRLRRCENPDCRSVFYDASRNRTRRWCCNACSSLIKVRRFRQRRKAEG